MLLEVSLKLCSFTFDKILVSLNVARKVCSEFQGICSTWKIILKSLSLKNLTGSARVEYSSYMKDGEKLWNKMVPTYGDVNRNELFERPFESFPIAAKIRGNSGHMLVIAYTVLRGWVKIAQLEIRMFVTLWSYNKEFDCDKRDSAEGLVDQIHTTSRWHNGATRYVVRNPGLATRSDDLHEGWSRGKPHNSPRTGPTLSGEQKSFERVHNRTVAAPCMAARNLIMPLPREWIQQDSSLVVPVYDLYRISLPFFPSSFFFYFPLPQRQVFFVVARWKSTCVLRDWKLSFRLLNNFILAM